MQPYICLTHALDDCAEAERLHATLIAYGFRCHRLHETSDPASRTRILNSAALVLALTSDKAALVESVADDLHRLPDKGRLPICISLSEKPNSIDERFCREEAPAGGAGRTRCMERIPYPAGATPDAQAVGAFIHRLFVCRLCPIEGAFSPSRCLNDRYGRILAWATAAHRNDAAAAYALGCAYERGEGVPILEAEAARWITRAAQAGLADAKLHLGELYLCGWGVEPDEERALALFTEVAETGDVRGEYRLGLCYLNAIGVVADPARALHHLRAPARWGYAPALYRLGLLYRDGIGTPKNARIALRCLYDACRRGAAAEAAHAAAPHIGSLPLAEAAPACHDAEEDPIPTEMINLRIFSDTNTTADKAFPASSREEASASSIPLLPPSLYGPRTGRTARRITMRLLRHRLTNAAGSTEIPAPSPSMRPHGRLTVAAHASRYHPEHAWIGSLTRSSHTTAPGGGRASGHPVLYVDRDDVAMGVPFDLSDAALALACLLERGDRSVGLLPRPTRAAAWYRYALHRGNTEALFRLAEAYRRGHGALTDPTWAVVLYRMAADWGDPRGQFALAVACERGIGTDTDMAEAIRRYEQAAMAGYAPAQNNLGGCYEHGVGVARNELTAVEWYIRAAEAGLPEAMCRLALCYEIGRGVTADPAQALALYRKAAEQSHPYALYRLGVCYDHRAHTGAGEVTPPVCDDTEHSDSTNANRTIRYCDATSCWQAAAEGGVAEAAYALALCYATGHGVRRDRSRAIQYLTEAARGNCIQAVYRLGMCFLEGNGVVRNTAHGVACLEGAGRLWRSRKALYLADIAPIPTCTQTAATAAGDALYMLGYCKLEGIGEAGTISEPSVRAKEASALFSEAGALGHVGALIALGDLYGFGRLSPDDGQSASVTASDNYRRAVRVSAARRGIAPPFSPDEKILSALEAIPLSTHTAEDPRAAGLLACAADGLSINSSPALMSLASDAIRRSEACREENDTDGSVDALEEAWQYFAAAVEQGSTDARVGMAECVYYGSGRDQDRRAALRMLQTAERASDGQIIVSLLIGDFLRGGWCGKCLPIDADDAYRRGLAAPPTESEVGPYTVSERRQKRLAQDQVARAELLYRLASFRSIYLSDAAHGGQPLDDGIDRRDTFAYLAEAVLMGHTAAREDLARMYAYERRYNAATAPAEKNLVQKKKRRSRKPRSHGNRGILRDHRVWLSDYYTALWPEPRPFRYALRSVAVPSHVPTHVTVPITPLMQAAALNYLGDCFFFGNGLDRRPSAAVACYREVAGMKPDLPRGEPTPEGIVWAQYSLGWCLLHGEGVARNEREAVRWLTAASRYHPEACFTLGECHEHGIGVDNADLREAVKFYRRALKLGYRQATAKVNELEELLRRRAEE